MGKVLHLHRLNCTYLTIRPICIKFLIKVVNDCSTMNPLKLEVGVVKIVYSTAGVLPLYIAIVFLQFVLVYYLFEPENDSFLVLLLLDWQIQASMVSESSWNAVSKRHI